MATFKTIVCTLLVLRLFVLLYAAFYRKEVRGVAFLFIGIDALSLLAIWGTR